MAKKVMAIANIEKGKKMKIGIFGHYGNLNLGDEATIEAVVQNMRTHLPNVEICCYSINPEDSKFRYNLPAYPIRYLEKLHPWRKLSFKNENFKFLVFEPIRYVARRACNFIYKLHLEFGFIRESFRTLKGTDLLLVAGSNQFLDNFGGTWGFPYTLLKWTVLSKLAGAKLAFVSVGAGPIDSVWSRIFVRVSLLFSDYVSFRDRSSQKLICMPILSYGSRVYPDLAYSLPVETNNGAESDQNMPIVGINPMPIYDSRYWCDQDDDKYNNYVNKLASFSSKLLRDGYKIYFFNTMPKDENVIDDVIVKLDEDVRIEIDTKIVIAISETVDELISTIYKLDIVVATRFHGTVLPLLAERPVLGICYHKKSEDLLKSMGQEKYFVKLDAFDVSEIYSKFNLLAKNYKQEKNKIKNKNIEYRELLNEQYVELIKKLCRN